MSSSGLPASAAWRHREARDGFESVFLGPDGSGYRLDGHVAAVEDARAWAVRYVITLDERWITRAARIWGRSLTGEHEAWLEADGEGHWLVNGTPMPNLDVCLDVVLEASACTNTFPVHRLRLDLGQQAWAPAAYVRAVDLDIERLEQQYIRVAGDGDDLERYDYRSPSFNFECRLVYDASGLVLEYPGIATRVL